MALPAKSFTDHRVPEFVQHLGDTEDDGQGENRTQLEPLLHRRELGRETIPVGSQRQDRRDRNERDRRQARGAQQRPDQGIQTLQQRFGVDSWKPQEQNA